MSDPGAQTKKLLSPEEVARICGLSRRAVYRAIARGELRAARLCNRLRVKPTELERWISTQAAAPECPVKSAAERPEKEFPRGSLVAMLDQDEDGSRR